MHIRRRGPILTIIFIIVFTVGFLRYFTSKGIPVQDPEPYSGRPSSTPVKTVLSTGLRLEVLHVTRVPTQATVAVEKNCTYHIYYWINHPGEWPATVVLGNTTYTRESTSALFRQWTQDLPGALTAQFYAAILNVIYGASQTEIDPYLVETNEWIKKNTSDAPLPAIDQDRGMELYALLEQFNTGTIGPGPCEDQPAIPPDAETFEIDGPVLASVSTATPTVLAGPHPVRSSPTLAPTHDKRFPRAATNTSTPGYLGRPSSTASFLPTGTKTLTPNPAPTNTYTPQASATKFSFPSSTPVPPTATSIFFATATRHPGATSTPAPAPTSTAIQPPAATDTPAPAPTSTAIQPPAATDTPAPPNPTSISPTDTPAAPTLTRTRKPTRTPKP